MTWWPWVVFDPSPGDTIEWSAEDGSMLFPTRVRGVFVEWGHGADVGRPVAVRSDGSSVVVSMYLNPRIVARRKAEPERPQGYRTDPRP